jgi:mycothiol synthase
MGILSPSKDQRRPILTTPILRPVTFDDATRAVRLFNLVQKHRDGDEPFAVENTLSDWRMPNFDLSQSARIIVDDAGEVLAYIEVYDHHTPPTAPTAWIMVHPDHHDLGGPLLAWAEQHARAHWLPQVPPDVRSVLVCTARQDLPNDMQRLLDFGMDYKRTYYRMTIEMATQPPKPAVLDGITLRAPHGEEEYRAIADVVDTSFKDHYGHIDQPAETHYTLWRQYMVDDNPDYDPSLWVLAVDDANGQIIGVSLGHGNNDNDPHYGWINTVGVLREYRGRGIAQALLYDHFGRMWDKDIRKVSLGVDASSLTGATRLYERVGMAMDRQFNFYEKLLRDGVEIRIGAS